MVNHRIFSFLFVLLFSSIISGQVSPNIIWEIQASPNGSKYLSTSAEGDIIFTFDHAIPMAKFFDSLGNLVDTYIPTPPGYGIYGGAISPTAEYFTVGYLQGIQLRGFSLVIRTENDSVLTSIQGNLSVFSSDGGRMVTAELSQMVYIYNIPDWNNPIIIMNGYSNPKSIDISNNYIAVGSDQNDLKLRDVVTGNLIHTFTDFDNFVSAVKFSPDGSILASGQEGYNPDRAIKVWNVNDYTLIAALEAFTHVTNSITYSSDGLYMIAAGLGDSVSSNTPQIKIWRTTDWTLLQTYDLDHNVMAIVSLPDCYRFLYLTNQGHMVMADYSELVPVEFTSFRASVNNLGQVVLDWNTSTETNNRIFEIQRKPSEDNFSIVGFVSGAGTTMERHNYSYIDKNVNAGDYIYRLKQIDFDGHFSYSNEVEVNTYGPATFTLAQNYPNPFNPTTNIGFSVPESGIVKLIVYNILGQEVAKIVDGMIDAGTHNVSFNASSLSGGVYIYKLQSNKSLIVKKMLLLK